MVKVVRQALWDVEVARSGRFDKIIIQNLEVTVNAGKDAWGRQKVQRAQISVTVTLNEQFGSAAASDTVDGSTIHYGTLSKMLQADLKNRLSEWASTLTLAGDIANSVKKVADSTPIYALETSICYLKGSMHGDGAGFIASRIMQDLRLHSYVLFLRNVRIPCLVGVNSNERQQKQPIVLHVWIECVHDSRTDDYAELESFLFTNISASEFQTLESMLEWTVQSLRQQFFTREEDQDSIIRLRIEKPLAVPFADAPAVEIMRPVRVK